MLTVVSAALFTGCASTPRFDAGHPVVEMQTTAGTITLQLNAIDAPISVENFLRHANAGHYDGTIFHRVIPTFVIQGGGWTAEFIERAKVDAAAGRPDTPITNEWTNGLKNEKWTIAMARETEPDSATREFYINVADNPKLDTAREKTGNAGYAVFGKVIDGFDAVERIRTGETGQRPDIKVEDGSFENVPLKPVVITRVKRTG
jgi:cyclophilin family peptidyl-prolyl cis-trans isomerase